MILILIGIVIAVISFPLVCNDANELVGLMGGLMGVTIKDHKEATSSTIKERAPLRGLIGVISD